MIEVSIVIPFRNLFQELEKCIAGILNQEIAYKFEIIVLDSSDESFENVIINLSSCITCVRIEPSTFNHGFTRQFALNYCKGKYVVYTVQDAIPVGQRWLHNLISPIVSENIDAVCGQQIVQMDCAKNPVQWFRPIDSPQLKVINVSPSEYLNKDPLERRKLTGWDNVNACYKKDILEKHPFANLNFGEDAFWADQALRQGLKIGYTSFAQVDHYHHYDEIQHAIRRVIAEYLIMKKTYDLNPTPYKVDLRRYLSIVKRISLSKISILDKLYWIKYNFRMEYSWIKAYFTWSNFLSLDLVEGYINNNIPQSTKNGR